MNKPYSHCKRKMKDYLLKRKQQRCKHEWTEIIKTLYPPVATDGCTFSDISAGSYKRRLCIKCDAIDKDFNRTELREAMNNWIKNSGYYEK
jgi:hypothetical protein